MARHRSQYHEYKIIGDGEYITELLCANRAKGKGLGLQYRFWTMPEWKGYYYSQLAKINNLLKYYSSTAIIKAVNKYSYSTCSDSLIKKVKEFEEELETAIKSYIDDKLEEGN